MHSGQRSAGAKSAEPQTARAHGGLLSPGERALWFLQRLSPGSAAYNLAGAIRIARLDAAALRRAVLRLVERHPALRTTFPLQDGEPVRQVQGWLEPEFVEEDVGGLPCSTVRARLEAEALRPFDPQHGPLLRVRTYQNGGRGAALFVFHHLIADFWSLTLILRELGALYGEETGGAPAELLPPPARYEQWVERQALELSGPRGAALRELWRNRLAGPVPLLGLPADRPRPAEPSGAGVGASGRVGPAATARLLAHARERGATLFAAILASFQLLLHRVTGDEEIWIGVPAAGRGAARWARTVGYFVNPVVLRGWPEGEESFSALVDGARAESEEALAHRDFPFPWLAEELQPARDGGRTPLFQAMLVLYRTRYKEEEPLALLALGEGGGVARLGGLELETLPLARRGAQLDISLTVAVVAGELRLRLELDADRFEAATARILLGRLEALLEAAAERPETPGEDLPLLREPERQALFFEWNDPRPAAPAQGSLDALVAEQAARTPHATALLCGERRLTYRELMERVERLARCLRVLGAGPEMRVGICAGRSLDLVIGILGILRTGAAYVPLDPAHPQERLAWTLEDSGAALLLTESPRLSLFPEILFEGSGLRALLLDVPSGEPPASAHGVREPGARRLAYVLYTSGSTGRPKGVALEHAGALALLRWANRHFEDEELAGVVASTSISFDLSIFELFLPLSRGGTVILVPDALHAGAAPGVTLINTVPSAMAELVRLGAVPPTVRVVCLAGERLPGGLAAAVHRAVPGCRVLNLYGPTESTTYSTWMEVEPESGREPAIGLPVDGTRVHVLDRRLEPVPVGVAGELFLAGAGLARGYVGRPDLTAERFVPDPWSPEPGGRLYRTGDLGRRRPDGVLEILGRLDQQIKLRGFRIELGEVEAALATHPAVRDAVVEVREDASGDRRLVAWIVGAAGEPDPAALRDHLAARLPGPMVPSVFAPLDVLPLTPNGKVDRRALAARPLPDEGPAAGYVPPRNSVEDSLAAVWAEVLGRERVGAYDDFFALGGHSLLATRVLARVGELFRVDLPLRDLFEAPTPSALAERLRVTARGRTAPPILPGAPGDPVVLSFAQERFWFLHRLEPDTPAYNVAGAVRIRGPLRVAALEWALGEIVRRHEVLRTCFPEVEGAPVALVEPPSAEPFPLARIDLAGLAPERCQAAAERLAAETAAAPFDLAGGPLLRSVLVRLGAEEHDLLVCVHHIAADGASIDLFFRELATLYREPGSLPDLAVQYADYARWQRSWLTGDVLEARLSWWEKELEGAPTALDLPTDRPRSAVSTSRGGLRALTLAPGLAEALDALRGRLMGTRFMSFAAVFQTLLGRLSGQADVLIGTPVSERSRRELEPLVGCLINTLVLRGRMGDDPPFEEQLRRIRATSLATWAHQELPFERLVERLPGARDASRTPLFQALLTVQSKRGTSLELGDAAVALRELDSGAAKLDLSLTLEAGDAGVRAILRYRRDLFDASTAQRFLEHFETLLAGGLADPSLRLSEIPLLNPAQRHQVLAEWGEGDPPLRGEAPVHELIRRRAAATPDAPAVLFEGRAALTWRELRRRSLRLARSLRAQGAAPGAVVGISLDRSIDLVVAVLATLETGAAYLPLDPAYPQEYLAYVVEDSGVSIILDKEAAWPLPEPGEEPGPPGGPPMPLDAWAYVLYTSGSTGKPKGTPVSHRALRNYLEWVLEAPLAGTDGILFLTSLNFDASLKQLFAPLLLGRPVRLLSDESARRPERLLGQLRGGGRLALNCVPSLWRAVLDLLEAGAEPARERVPALDRLLLGGEGFDRDLVDRTLRLLPGLEIWNLYGPTEATANASAARLVADDRFPLGIGRPVRGVCLHVLDPFAQIVPPGTAGELVIGGVGVAPGYWQRPDLTAERFVPDPFAVTPGARLFRTGDLARWRADGSLELLGRIDRQLKIRGLRIEPGEVETVLAAHPAVAECVVGADPSGSRLVAWVVPRSGSALVAAELRRTLEALLPPALVPSAFVILGALPRLPNGKVSHAALPAPEAPVPRTAAAEPRSQAEEVLAWLWCEVLEVPSIGIHDDFFERGGHSLLAARLLARVRGVFAVDLPLRTLFAAPTVARLSEAIAAARRERRDEEVPVEPVARTGPLPLSFAQERLWFIDQWLPESPAYNIPAAVRLRGPLDVGALGAALAEIVRRHETLRTTFSVVGGQPVQVVRPEMRVPLPVADLAGLEDAEPVWRALAGAEARRGFDLRRGPLLRTTLLRLGEADHVLVVNLHHIVSDGWSMGVLIEELRTLYVAFREGLPSPLPALPVQYADYAVWQRDLATRQALARDLDWWRGFLAGAPAALELPADRPRPLWSIHRGGVEPVALPPALTARLHELARRGEVTLFMILLAGFELLLARLAGVDDLVVGTAVAQRTPEVERLIGLFVNLLALRGDLSGDPRFTDLLARTRRATLEAHDHQHVPFERLVASLEPARDPGRHPLFQAALTLQNAPMPEMLLPGIALETEQLDTGTARFDLTLLLHEENGGLAGALEHSADLFDRSTVRRFLASWASLLAGIVDDPLRPVSLLPLMSEAEQRQILEVWSHGADQRPREACLHELFARQAARAPHAVALVEEGPAGEAEMTYGELDRRSALLAWRLRAAGAGPDVPVAVLLERSADMVVALLGILRAGAGYVPLDLGYPQERLAWMLEDSGARLVVARGNPPGGLAEAAQVVRIDDLPADQRVEPPAVAVSPDHLAYIVYTSGSTGKPKGVAATHRGVTRVVIDPGYVELGPEETILQLAPVPFDASTFEIWGALLNGGRLAIYPSGPLALHELSAALRSYRVTTLFLTTGLFHQMIDEEIEGLAGLRQLITGGDVISVARVRRALDLLPGCRLIHAYGPTETTTYATCHPVTAADAARPTLTLGRPIPRTTAWLFDERLEPVPAGVPGEMFLGGDGLARGYWGRPDLTAPRFVPHPFPAAPGERLYRTGDLARWLPDGTLDFLGRIDRQVKIRGFRVEPAEIEATLERHPEVSAAVVAPRDDGRGNKRLVAWVAGERLSESALLAWCREHLPAFMVPGAFVLLAALPLDPNGKVDRKALPAPELRGGQFVPPQTPEEEWIAAVWAEVLGATQVGIEDDFFALGGHSLLAARLISRLRAVFGVDLPVRALFEHPTVGALAAEVGRLVRAGVGTPPPPRPRADRGPVAPLSFAQRRLWVLHQLDPGLIAYHIPAALRLRGRLDREALAWALGEIVRRHEALRTSFLVVEGEPFQEAAPAADLQLPDVDLSALPEARRQAEARRIAGAAARRPFDLEHGPLLRLRLLRLDAEEHVLILVVHHLVFDGWSTAVFLRELSALYDAFLHGQPSPLPEPALQLGDWALWQREHLQGEALEAQLSWWRDRLASAPRVLDLPTDFPRPPHEAQAGASVPVRLPETLTAALRGLGQAEGATLFMVLLAAFQALLARWSGEETVCTGTHVAGRSRLESEDLIGFFVNTVVLRTDLDGAPSGRELIGRVREMVLGAFAHQDLPFEKLVEALQPPRQPGMPPLYQVAFTLQNAPREGLRLPGLEVDFLPAETGTTQLDLSLTLVETGGDVAGEIRYRTALFAEPTVRRLVQRYESLLAALGKEPGGRVLELPILSVDERAQVVEEWSGLAASRPIRGDATFPALFEAQVDRAPDAPALVLAGRTLTYRELDRAANRVAHRLRSHGVGAETRVLLHLERSPQMLAALLGVWKAGGAYVPIDAATPPERLAFLRQDAGAALELTGAEVERLERAGEDDRRLGLAVLPEQLAYAIYTSGSTGQPKGVLVTHGSLIAFSRGLAEVIGDGGVGLRFAVNASLAFDASLQLFLQLLTGACVWVVPEEARRDADHMAGFLRAADLDGIDCTPSQLELILDAIDASGAPPRCVLVGGEPIPPSLWSRMAERSGTRFWNVYGPTEATINVTARPVEGERPDLGHPWPGARVWLLESSGELAPAGARGEIWLGGPQVARGYLGRPDLTADRFRPDPFSGEAGARLYRTGDLARWLPDGRLDLLGRADQQVKLRGHRIELGEIEAQLLGHPRVREAAAGVRTEGGSPRLVAWITFAEGPAEGAAGETGPRELRRWLGERLPGPMVPSAFVVLDRLPRTTSGKLDRRALPDPPRLGRRTEAQSPGLSSDWIETRLRDLFREVLEVDRVEPTDNLFELGGHSMTAFRLATRIREAFGVRLAVSRLFSDPTPAALAAVIRGMEREGTGLLPVPPVHPVPRDRPLPLSLAQQRLWVLHQITPGLTTYHIPAGLRLRGRLDVPALHGALTEILRRHEALRTHFPLQEGEPVQEIDPPAPAALPVLDLSALPVEEREAEARRAARVEALRPFDLERGPLLRLGLLRLGAEDHALLLVVHHLVSDGWSTALFLRELAVLYEAGVHGEPSPLPEPPVQYADWAVWQREQLHAELLEAHLRWWTERLAGAPRVLDLPLDRPRPPVEDPAGASVPFRLPKPLVETLRQLALAEGASLYMTLLAGFQALLSRIAGQETVSVGTHVARRNRLEVEGLIGFFVNTVVIRADVPGERTGRELVHQVRDSVFGAFAHQDLPFERLIEALDLERDPRWSPLFQVSFALQNAPHEEPRLPGLDVELLETDTGAGHFDLAATLTETAEGGAAGALAYRTALFFPSTIRRLAGQYQAFLEALAAQPDVPLSELPLLTAPERHQILVEWAGPERGDPERSLPELFTEQAARTPGELAVVCGTDSITYGDLDRRSDQLAGWLRAQGLGPESAVAISVERSVEMVVGLLGILKAGAAYLPIDPLNPRERQAFLLEDAGVPILLTQEKWAEGFQAPGRQVVCLEAPSPGPSPAERERGTSALSPSVPVFLREGGGALSRSAGEGRGGGLQALLYTSGSTGRPKATMLEARGLLNLCLWFRDICPIGPHTRSLLGFSFSFDAAFKNILVPLLTGGRTVLPPPGPFDAGEMLEAIRRERVTFLNTTPSQMVLILQRAAEEGWAGLESLETLILGGEAAPWAELRPWLASGRCHAEILHMYGPSEVSDTVSCHRATPAEIAAADRLPVGRAADNTRLLVVDAGFQPLPIGVPGELCLAGHGVARGYLGRPALTAEKFIPDPLHPGDRMYRTGDLARWLADGSVEILGRIDHQVKIRGIRVEPAEVEAALASHPAVGGVVVGTREGAAGEKRLIAWIVPAPGSGSTDRPEPAELREHLRTRLPEVMIPAAFVIVPAFPVSPRGKIDRNALPDPGAEMEDRPLLPPRDETELRLTGLFQEVLGSEAGIRDSFFDRGGHSLAAVRLAGRIRETFGVPFQVADLFLAPTVEEIASLLRRDRKPVVSRLVTLRPSGDHAPLFLLPPGGGSVFDYVDLARRLDVNRPILGLQAQGLEEGEEPLRDLGEMAEQYLEEIRRAQPAGPLHLAGWSFGGLLAFEVARRLRARGDEIAALALIDPTDPPEIQSIPSGDLALAGLVRELGIPLDGFEPTPEQSALPAEERLALLYEKARAAGRLRPWDDLSVLRRRFEVIRVNAGAARTFRPGPYDGPLDLFEPIGREAPIAGNWRPLARRLHTLPGTHYSLLFPPHVDVLAAALRELLDRGV